MTRADLARIAAVCASEETTAAELRHIIRRLLREVELQERVMREAAGRAGVN